MTKKKFQAGDQAWLRFYNQREGLHYGPRLPVEIIKTIDDITPDEYLEYQVIYKTVNFVVGKVPADYQVVHQSPERQGVIAWAWEDELSERREDDEN
jgi:hypothetical protein